MSRSAYIDYALAHYFDEIDLNDSVLFQSRILYDRLEEYLFKIPIMAYGKEKSNEYIRRLKLIFDRLTYLPARASILKTFMVIFSKEDKTALDYLTTLYEKLPEPFATKEFTRHLREIMTPVRGVKFDAAYLTQKTKARIKPSPYHLFIFYSSNCPHCQTQLPVLHDWLEEKRFNNIHVIAVGLEENPGYWKSFSRQLKNWKNAYVSGSNIMPLP